MYKTISQSIGKGGYNTSVADVKTVQELLNAIPTNRRGSPPYANVDANGKAGYSGAVLKNWNNTIIAILAFQKTNGCTVDGRVDPAQYGGTTIVKMNAIAQKAAKWLAETQPMFAMPDITVIVTPKICRVTSREWFSSQTQGPGAMRKGGAGARLGGAVGRAISASGRGGTDKRTYRYYPYEWLVTRVDEICTARSVSAVSSVTTFYDRLITYTYGVPGPTVWLHRESSLEFLSNFPSDDRKTPVSGINRAFLRSDIWTHTTGPEEATSE